MEMRTDLKSNSFKFTQLFSAELGLQLHLLGSHVHALNRRAELHTDFKSQLPNGDQ